MHELSIIQSVVSITQEALVGMKPGSRVAAVKLRVGALSGVAEEPLRFCYELATENTPLAGSELRIERVPVAIYCSRCTETVGLPGVQSFRCPRCHTPSADVRRGRELELESVVVAEEAMVDCAHG